MYYYYYLTSRTREISVCCVKNTYINEVNCKHYGIVMQRLLKGKLCIFMT
jgi:hypothetical protein